jgi:hypothetical protein
VANVPEQQQIVPEDFEKKNQDMVAKIADPINTYIEQLNEILNKNLTFAENFRGELKTVTVVGGVPLKFKYNNTAKPIGMWVLDYSNLTDPTEVLTAAVQAQWTPDGKGNITIDNVTAITATETYTLTIMIISG